MIDENRATPNRIPVRFVDDAEGAGDLTPEELGRASAYEDATEMQRRGWQVPLVGELLKRFT